MREAKRSYLTLTVNSMLTKTSILVQFVPTATNRGVLWFLVMPQLHRSDIKDGEFQAFSLPQLRPDHPQPLTPPKTNPRTAAARGGAEGEKKGGKEKRNEEKTFNRTEFKFLNLPFQTRLPRLSGPGDWARLALGGTPSFQITSSRPS